MIKVKIQNKNIKHIQTTKVQNKLKMKIPRDLTGNKYYIIPVPLSCPIITDRRYKEQKIPSSPYFEVETEEIRIYNVPKKNFNHSLSIPKKWEGKHVLLIPYENSITIKYKYTYILTKEKNNNKMIYIPKSIKDKEIYCSTDNKYKINNNNIIIHNPSGNITRKNINTQRKIFTPKNTSNILLFL